MFKNNKKPRSYNLFLILILTLCLLASCGDKKKEPEKIEDTPPQQVKQVTPPQKEEKTEEIQEISPEIKTKKAQEAKRLINEAIQYNDERDYKSALKSLKKAIDIGEAIDLPFSNAYSMSGEIYQRFKDYKNAAFYYEKYLQRPDKDKLKVLESISDVYYNWGMLYNRFFESALNLHIDYYTYGLEMLASINPKQKEAIRYFRGLGYYLSRRFDKAIDDLRKVGKIGKPYDDFTKIKLAACYYEKGDKKTAESIWAKINSESRQNSLISSELLITYMEVGKPVKAADLSGEHQKILKLLEKTDDNYMARGNLITINAINGELDLAIELFKSEDLKIPDMTIPISANSRAKFYRNSIFRTMAKVYFLKAAEYYGECIEASPQKIDEYNYKIGLCLLYGNKLDEGIKNFSQITSEPFKSKADVYTGVCFYQKGDKEKAEQIWDRLAKENLIKKDKNTLYELSYAYSRLAIRLQDALDYAYGIRDPLAIAYAHYKIAMESENQEDRVANFTSAAQWFDKSRNIIDYYLDFNNPVVLSDLANTYYHLHTYDESARIWTHLMDIYPEAFQIFESIQLINEIWQMNKSKEFRSRWVNPIS